jgi:hypothetical protein
MEHTTSDHMETMPSPPPKKQAAGLQRTTTIVDPNLFQQMQQPGMVFTSSKQAQVTKNVNFTDVATRANRDSTSSSPSLSSNNNNNNNNNNTKNV